MNELFANATNPNEWQDMLLTFTVLMCFGAAGGVIIWFLRLAAKLRIRERRRRIVRFPDSYRLPRRTRPWWARIER